MHVSKHVDKPASDIPITQREAEYKQIIAAVLDTAVKNGAHSAEVGINSGTGLSVTARVGQLERLEYERDKGLDLTVYINGSRGSASSTDFSEKALLKTIDLACTIARYAGRDDYAGLADAALMATEIPALALYYPWHISPDQATDAAIECEQYALDHDRRICNSEGATVNTYSGIHLYGNTHGFIGSWPWSAHTIDCNVIAKEGNGMQCDGWYSRSSDYRALQSRMEVGTKAAQRTIDRLGAQRLNTQHIPVLFEAAAAKDLFSTMVSAISGARLYQRNSFLLDQKGQKIFPEYIQIRERPHLKKALGSAPFDNDGVATRERDLVKDGVLLDYVLDAYSARKLGLQTTANAGGVHNLVIAPSNGDLADLIKMMDRGLLVTDTIGFGINLVTGDYSRGASGFWVERGACRYPVEGITIAGQLRKMYQNILATGNDIDRRGNILTGSILIAEMIVAGA